MLFKDQIFFVSSIILDAVVIFQDSISTSHKQSQHQTDGRKLQAYKDIDLILCLAAIYPVLHSVQVLSSHNPSKDQILQHHEEKFEEALLFGFECLFIMHIVRSIISSDNLLHGYQTNFPILVQFLTNICQDRESTTYGSLLCSIHATKEKRKRGRRCYTRTKYSMIKEE